MLAASGDGSIRELVLTACLSCVAYLVAIVIARAISNQAARFKFKKLSRNLPLHPEAHLLGNHIVSVPLGSRNCDSLQRCHLELGPTIGWLRGSKFCASTIDLDLIKTFILDEPEAHLDRSRLDLPLHEIEHSIMLAPEHEWRQLRRAIAPALASNRFKTPNVLGEIDVSIRRLVGLIERRLDAAGGSPNYSGLFEVDELIQKYSIDLVFRCFYKQDNIVDFDHPRDRWVTMIDTSFHQMQHSWLVKLAGIFPELCGLLDWLSWHFTEQGRGRRETGELVELQARHALEARKQIQELNRVANETGTRVDVDSLTLTDGTVFRRNMVDHIIDQYLNGKITRQQFLDNSSFLMAAANRTASDCLIHTIYQLSIDQDMQERTRKSVLTDGHESEYLGWVLKESLRLLPPAPTGCSRTISRDIPLSSGHILPAGTFVVTCAFVIHRLKEYWGDDAEEFKPDRWRDTSHHHPLQYMPFGAGPRGCPGRAFAVHEMKMLMATLLTRYRFEGEPRDDVYDFDSPWWIFVIPRSPTRVKISRL